MHTVQNHFHYQIEMSIQLIFLVLYHSIDVNETNKVANSVSEFVTIYSSLLNKGTINISDPYSLIEINMFINLKKGQLNKYLFG